MNGPNSPWGYDGKHQWNDRHSNSKNNSSAISKMQHHYWVTKQTVFRKLGKKEDANIVASDAELDAKLELFRSIRDTCSELERIIDKYQERLWFFAQEEDSMARFLKESGKHDKTGAGSMMVCVGKTMSHSGQHRIALRLPLIRLNQEVETFRHRAVDDTWNTVMAMEKARTEYRASLSWMKDVSQELDPDTYKQLEKFRKVQEHVKLTKARFDKLKLDCLQKIDLLAAARCNMFSHALITYHNTLLQFATSSAEAFSSIGDSFKDYQRYEFNVVKELSEMKPEEVPQSEQEPDEKLLDFEDLESQNKEEDNKSGGRGEGLDLFREWEELEEKTIGGEPTNQEDQCHNPISQFLPSQLLIQPSPANDSSPSFNNNETAAESKPQANAGQNNTGKRTMTKSSWVELFSELDPLANPDSIGQPTTEPQRNC